MRFTSNAKRSKVRAITANDLAHLAKLGLDQTLALRAMAQDMAWLVEDDEQIFAAATARLADGTVFLDALVGDDAGRLTVVDHAIAYARWSYAPALTLLAPENLTPLEERGFVGLDPAGLPPTLLAAANTLPGTPQKVLVKRL